MIPIQILSLSQPSMTRRDTTRRKFFLIKRRERFQRGLVVTLVVVVVLVVIAVEVALSRTMKKRKRETNKWAHCLATMISQNSKKCLT